MKSFSKFQKHQFKGKEVLVRTYAMVGLLSSLVLGSCFFVYYNQPTNVIVATLMITLLGFISFVISLIKIGRSWSHAQRMASQMQTILQNFRHGVLIIDSKGNILPNYTEAAEEMFAMSLEGKNLAEVLRLKGAAAESVIHWIELIFSGMMSFDELVSLGPKSFEKVAGKYIQLDYMPINNSQNKLDRILIVASDNTEEKRLKDKSEIEYAQANIVMTVMKDREGFQQFIRDTRQSLQQLIQDLDCDVANVNIERILRNLHTIKGVSLQYHVLKLYQACKHHEAELINLNAEGTTFLKDFFPTLQKSVLQMARDFEYFVTVNEKLIGKVDAQLGRKKTLSMDSIHKMAQSLEASHGNHSPIYKLFVDEFVLEDFSKGLDRYRELVVKLSEYQGKIVEFEMNESGISVCLDSYVSLLNALVHVFRNSIDHGIESVSERELIGKPVQGRVSIEFKNLENQEISNPRFQVRISDDGRGMNPNFVRERARSRGVLTEAQAEKLSDTEILQFVFRHGMTTSDSVTDISGRGVGLDSLKYETAKIGGSVWVESILGGGTSIILELPIFTSPVFYPGDISQLKQLKEPTKKNPKKKLRKRNKKPAA